MADRNDGGRLDGQPEPVRDTCGCEAGAAALLVGAAVCVAYLLARPGGFWPVSLSEVAIGASVCAAAAIGGKVAALLWARLIDRSSPKRTRANSERRTAGSPQDVPHPDQGAR